MAAYNGFDGVVKNATTSADLGRVQSWSADITSEGAEKWGMGSGWKERKSTVSSASGSVECEWDDADPHNDITAGSFLTLGLYPGGDGAGSTYLSGRVRVATVGQSVNKNGDAMKTFSWESDGPMSVEVTA